MAKTHAVRRIALFLALSLLVAPWAFAGPSGESGQGFFLQAWNLLTSFWSDEGCNIDPNGRCIPMPASLDTGCNIDPDGRCLSSPGVQVPMSDTGCNIDPNGRGCYQ
jgi:hypothetical protein